MSTGNGASNSTASLTLLCVRVWSVQRLSNAPLYPGPSAARPGRRGCWRRRSRAPCGGRWGCGPVSFRRGPRKKKKKKTCRSCSCALSSRTTAHELRNSRFSTSAVSAVTDSSLGQPQRRSDVTRCTSCCFLFNDLYIYFLKYVYKLILSFIHLKKK